MELTGRCLPPADHLGARILALRSRYGWSQRQLAAASQTSPSTIASMEAGNLGHLAVLERVGHALGAGLTLVAKGRGTGFFSLAATSSAWDSWATPQEVLDRLYPVVGGLFDLDPCAPRKGRSRVRAHQHLTADDDGLTHEWHGTVYMNPPYGRTSRGGRPRPEPKLSSGGLRRSSVSSRPERTQDGGMATSQGWQMPG